jgi:hypothetical protein
LIALACLDSRNLNYSNRPVRTRMPGGVGGDRPATGRPYPDCPAAAARRRAEHTFAQWAEEWLERYSMAGSTRDMRRSVYERDLKGPFGKLKLEEITAEELRVAWLESGCTCPIRRSTSWWR